MNDDRRLDAAVTAAARGTLENMAFAELEACEAEAAAAAGEDWYWSRIDLQRPLAGALTLHFTAPLIGGMVADLLGDPGTSPRPAEILDALGELANTMVGILARELLPEQAEFELGLPQTGTGAPPPPAEGERAWHFLVNGEPLFRVTLALQEGGER